MAMQDGQCPQSIDRAFGPWAGPTCRGGFDFTLLFEETILSILPQCIFLLVLPLRLWQLVKQEAKVISSPLRWYKLGATVILLSLNIALLAIWCARPGGTTTDATTPAATIAFIATLAMCLHLQLEHERNVRPSFIGFIYNFLSMFLDLARARTLWMLYPSRAIPAIFVCTLIARAILLTLESIEKRSILVPKCKDLPREKTSSTISHSVFFWLTPLLRRGYRRILGLDDLDRLDSTMESSYVGALLAESWSQVPDQRKPGALFSAWLSAFTRPVLRPIIPKLVQIAFNYSQPLLINAAINLAVRPQTQPFNNWGYGLIGAYIIVYVGIAISTGQCEHQIYRAASMMRGSIVALVYEKSLRLDIHAPDLSPEAALTMVGTDTETMIQGIVMLHELWGSLIEIGVGIYLIYRELGAACAMPVAGTLIVLIGSVFVAIPTGSAQAVWIQASQDRVTSTAKALGSIKWLKMSGLAETAFANLRKLRRRELEHSERFRVLLGVAMILLICAPIFIPILTFGTFAGIAAGKGDTLTIAKAFTSFAVFALLSTPLTKLIMALPLLASALACFQRVQGFLNLDERKDNRIHGPPEGQEKGVIASIQGSITWKDKSECGIDVKDLSIRRHTITALLGPVGCGKSTVIKCLLGELSAFQGKVTTDTSSVAYCAQGAWLPNTTVQQIIIGSEKFEETWYNTVLQACELHKDLNTWPKGDQTAVGTRGISLSGGQKHRIAIARSVYSRREFQIFDDVFSGLDSNTASSILENLFGANGILQAGDVTVFIASSDTRHIAHASEVIIMNDKGQIEEAGKLSELSYKFSHFGSITENAPNEKTELSAASAPETQAVDAILTAKQIEADTLRRLGDSRMYSFYAKSAGWFPLIIFAIGILGFAFCSTFSNIWLKWWSEANTTSPNANLGKWLGVYAVLGVGSAFSALFGMYHLFIVCINNSGVYFHDQLIDTTSRATMSFHSTTDSGITINRFSQDLAQIDMEFPAAVLGLSISVANGIGMFVLIAVSGKYIAAFLPLLILVFYVIQHVYLRTSRQMRLLDIEYKAPVLSHLIGAMNGLATIRAFQWEPRFTLEAISVINDSQRPSYLFFCLQRWLTFSMDMMIGGIAVVLVIIVSTLREQIGPGYTGIALSNVLGFSSLINAAITTWIMLETALGAIARVRGFVEDTKSEWDDYDQSHKFQDESWPQDGAVEFNGLTASYDSGNPVLRDVTLSIKPGEKIAVCGRTGSGKSSLALAPLRMINITSGKITISGIDTSTIPPEHLRSKLVAVPQESYIFDGSVRLNVDPSEAVPDEEIIEALKEVQLWETIQQKGGLDASTDEKSFSQGEAQLLMLARAMVRKGRILILDEVTSSLDDKTSKIVNQVISTWFRDWTVISIMHKLDAVLEYGKVAVLDAGQLIEFDAPSRLLERDSAFRRVYEMGSNKSQRL